MVSLMRKNASRAHLKLAAAMLAALLLLFHGALPLTAGAADGGDECTLAGAAGYFAKGGGCMVLKNRDRNTRFVQSLDFVKEDGGYFFIGVKNISSAPKDRLAYTMGINEKGLICVSSSPPNKINFNFRGRKYEVYHPGVILSKIATVDEFIEKVLKAGKIGSAMNYIVADAQKMCLVELVDEMHYDYKIVVNGALCQTNHYHMDKMLKYQGLPVNRSTADRLARAKELVIGSGKTLSAADFMAAAADHGRAGEYNDLNICRHPDSDYGSKKFDGGTISSMVLISRPGEPPQAYVSIGQPCAAGYEKLSIINGACELNPLKKALYKSGAANMAADLTRDAYYHFIMPFVRNGE